MQQLDERSCLPDFLQSTSCRYSKRSTWVCVHVWGVLNMFLISGSVQVQVPSLKRYFAFVMTEKSRLKLLQHLFCWPVMCCMRKLLFERTTCPPVQF